jgi:hypothetical protein
MTRQTVTKSGALIVRSMLGPVRPNPHNESQIRELETISAWFLRFDGLSADSRRVESHSPPFARAGLPRAFGSQAT